MYLSELAPSSNRGAIVAFNEVMVCVGCLVSLVVAVPLGEVEGGWRITLGASAIPAAAQALALALLPQSPRWLFMRGSHQRAAVALMRLRGVQGGATEMAELEEVQQRRLLSGARARVRARRQRS